MKNKYRIVGTEDDGKTFTNDEDLIKYLRSRGDEEYNDVSDDFIFNEAYQHGWFDIIED